MFALSRIYSQSELDYHERELHKRFRIGDVFAIHKPCAHRYRVKKGGRKEQAILKEGNNVLDEQSCSICFKTRCTDDNPSFSEIEYVTKYDGDKPTIELLTFKMNFYKWLYERI